MVQISIAGDSVLEDDNQFLEFVVTLSQAAVDAVTVNFRTLRGTALDEDLDNFLTGTLNNGVLTFAPGQTSGSIFIESNHDTLDERDEHIIVELYDPSSNATFAGDLPVARATGVMLDDDGPGSNLALFVSEPVLVEADSGQTNAVFEVRLSQPAPSAFTVSYQTADGTAISGQDYVSTSGVLSFAPGQEVLSVSVPVIGDTVGETAEFFSLIVTPPSSPSIGIDGAVGEAIILDTDTSPLPEISIEGDVVVEDDSNYLHFVVTLSEAATDAVTVNFRTLRGTALDEDLDNFLTGTLNNGVLTFAPGQTSGSIFIESNHDTLDERDEHIIVELYDPSSNATFAGDLPVARATGVMLDDDGPGSNLALFVSEPVLVEADSGQTNAVFEVRLSQPAPSAFTVSYQTADGTAISGQDYVSTSGVLSFAPGQEVLSVSVPVIGDTVGETAEFFSLIVTPPSSPSIGIDGAVGEAIILDTDTSPLPEISIEGDVVVEDDSNYLHFVVTLSEAATDAVTVNFRTLRGTALDEDLDNFLTGTLNNGVLTFAPGQTSGSIFIESNHDTLDERDEHIIVELYDPSSNATFAGDLPVARATGVMLDDDGPGSNLALFVSEPVLVEADSGQTNAVFEVRLSQPAPSAFTVSYQTADGTAISGQDYVSTSGVLSFAPGQEVLSVSVPVIGDTVGETAEFFSLIVTPPSSPSIGIDGAVGEAIILDTDTSPLPEISIEGDVVVEDDSNYLRFVVTLSEASSSTVSVDFNTTLGTTLAADFDNFLTGTLNNGVLTFAPGETSGSIFIESNHDTLDERDESMSIRLTNAVGAVFSGGVDTIEATGFMLDDDGAGLNIALAGTDLQVRETDQSTTTHYVTVELSQSSSSQLIFDVTATNGSAIAGLDFELLDTTVTFAAGQTRAAVAVNILGDSIAENDETFSLDFALQAGLPFAGPIPNTIVTIKNGPPLAGPTNGNDHLTGTAGNDSVNLLAGNDSYLGLAGDDVIRGGSGNDILNGGLGTDTMYGGTGNDRFYVDSTSDRIYENAGEGIDFVYATTSSLTLSANVERLIFTDGGNHVGRGNALDNRLNGNTGNDKFVLDAGGADVFSGGSGSDSFDARSSTNGISINLITGVHGGDATGDIFASIEKFFGSITEDDYMRTGAARADFAGFGGNDTLIGGNSVDRISGGSGDDVLFGGSASDTLQGGADNDTLNGGGGRDSFLYVNANFGQDTITDFQDGIDRLRVFSAVADNISDFTIANNGTSTVRLSLNSDPTNYIDINGIGGSNITIDASDFLFY